MDPVFLRVEGSCPFSTDLAQKRRHSLGFELWHLSAQIWETSDPLYCGAVQGAGMKGLGPVLLRFVLAVVFIAHGANKLFGVWAGPGIGAGGLSGTAAFLDTLHLGPAFPPCFSSWVSWSSGLGPPWVLLFARGGPRARARSRQARCAGGMGWGGVFLMWGRGAGGGGGAWGWPGPGWRLVVHGPHRRRGLLRGRPKRALGRRAGRGPGKARLRGKV